MITDVILEMIYFYSWTKNLIYVLILCPPHSPISTCWRPTHHVTTGKRAFKKVIKINDCEGEATEPIDRAGFLIKEDEMHQISLFSTCAQRRGYMSPWWEGGCLQVKRRGLKMKPTPSPALWSWLCQPPELWEANFWPMVACDGSPRGPIYISSFNSEYL